MDLRVKKTNNLEDGTQTQIQIKTKFSCDDAHVII